MEEEQNSGTLEGTTEPTVVDAGRVFVNTGPNYPVQKNAAAKVIADLQLVTLGQWHAAFLFVIPHE